MAKTGLFLSTLALVLTLAYSKSSTTTGLSCSRVTEQLAPCLGFIIDKVDKPSTQCCSGATQVADVLKSKKDRQAVCECLKEATSRLSKVDYNRIPQITKICGIKISLPPINKGIDCKSIPFKDLIA